MARVPTLLLLLLAASASGGCTAGIATARILSARQAVLEAHDMGAEHLAPYEYQLARRNLQKAVEASGDAQHRTGVELADAARAWADRAIARTGGRDVGTLEDDVRTLRDAGPDPLFGDGEEPVRGTPEPRGRRPAPRDAADDALDDFLDDAPEDEPAPWEADR